MVDIATPEFKRAALSRLLEYTSAFGATGFPADLPVMREWQQEQAERELEPWQREWLPFALRPTAPSEPPCDNTEVYRDYELWHDSEGDGPKISKEKIGRAVCAHYGITPGKQQRGAHGVRVRPYQGYALLISEEWGDGAQVRYLSRGG